MSTQAVAMRADGKQFVFNLVGGVWRSDADVDAKLTALTDGSGNVIGWTYKTPDDQTESYDKAGKLISVSNRAGLTVQLAYDPSNRLHIVSDPFGRTLTLSYDSLSRLSMLIDPNNKTTSYTYDSHQNLSTVSYPDGAVRT
jgi:YD repeat-containing protein